MLDGELEIRTLLCKWFKAKKNQERKLCDRCANNGKWEGCNPNIPIISCIEYKEKPLTNADRIRNMTDEELAEYHDMLNDICCPNHGAMDCRASCEECWLKWLKEEVKDGSN